MSERQTPFFSIGVTTYDRNKLLKETLSSIINQTFPDFEVIVSNDNPKRKLSRKSLKIFDSRIKFVNQAKNLGERKNMNFLLASSQGKYFTWFADDDLYHPQFLEAVYTAIVKHGYPFCLFTSYKMGDTFLESKKHFMIESQIFTGKKFLQLYLSKSIKTQGCYGIFKKPYLKQLGGMPKLGKGFSSGYQDLPGNVFYPYADNLLAIQAGISKNVVFIDAPLIFYRAHKGSVSLMTMELEAYASAQKELCLKFIRLYKNKMNKNDFHSNLFYLLKWFINDYVVMVRRSHSLIIKKGISYLKFIKKYHCLLWGTKYFWQLIFIIIKKLIILALSNVKIRNV